MGTKIPLLRTCRIETVVIFGGGIPIVFDGNIIGAVGASAGTVEQDIAVAEAGAAALSFSHDRAAR
jgi:uncharacterized protein GlcG (DUF336 family)